MEKKGCLVFSEKDDFESLTLKVKDKTGHYMTLNKWGSVTPKGKNKKDKVRFKRRKVVWGQQSGTENDPKVILIEEIVWNGGKKELRFGYRTVTHKQGRWGWGQFALMTPIEDFLELLNLAKENGLLEL